MREESRWKPLSINTSIIMSSSFHNNHGQQQSPHGQRKGKNHRISPSKNFQKPMSHHSVVSQSFSSFSSSYSSTSGTAAADESKDKAGIGIKNDHDTTSEGLLLLKQKTNTSSCEHYRNEHTLKKRRVKVNQSQYPLIVLPWKCFHRIPSVQAEEALLPLLLPYGEKERGMMYKQYYKRIATIRDACKEHKIDFKQALSMRRTHMKLLNPDVEDIGRLGLGRLSDIRKSADLFEEAVAVYLQKHGIEYYTENDQKAIAKSKGERTPPTPDFLLKEPIILESFRHRPIHWIEAKMFYAASTVPDGTNNAVGCLLSTARRYVQVHGPGAFVFSFGYGVRMKSVLEAEGVIVLDARPLNLKRMEEHQRTWCANDRGQILP